MYDIAIVGGGPAGATFARLMGKSGKKIVLIDGQSARNKKPCGGLLAPDAQKVLAHFDLTLPKSVLVDPQIFSVKTIDLCSGDIRFYPRHYLNVDRYAFDRWLLSLVPPEVEVCEGQCIKAEREEDHFILTLRSNGETKTIKAQQIVGADGANSLIRKSFFKSEIMHYVAIQQWYACNSKSNPFYSCVFDPVTSESCSWSIFKDGYFIFGGCFLPKDCKAAFEAQKERLAQEQGFVFDQLIKTEACMALRPKKPTDFCTGQDGIYLIGEAAGFISPSSFEGISNAIISGNMLADAMDRYGDPKRIAKAYHKMTLSIRTKLMLKTVKRWFMYTPLVRHIIMKTGVGSIKLYPTER